MMEDLITDLRNMTGMGRFARSEVREILGYLESVGWLSEPKAAEEAMIEPEPAPKPPLPPSAVNDLARNYMTENANQQAAAGLSETLGEHGK